MINSMKLKGTGLDLAAYYYKQENYYFDQSSEWENFVSDETRPGNVQLFGSLCNYLAVRSGTHIQLAQFYTILFQSTPLHGGLREMSYWKAPSPVTVHFQLSTNCRQLTFILILNPYLHPIPVVTRVLERGVGGNVPHPLSYYVTAQSGGSSPRSWGTRKWEYCDAVICL